MSQKNISSLSLATPCVLLYMIITLHISEMKCIPDQKADSDNQSTPAHAHAWFGEPPSLWSTAWRRLLRHSEIDACEAAPEAPTHEIDTNCPRLCWNFTLILALLLLRFFQSRGLLLRLEIETIGFFADGTLMGRLACAHAKEQRLCPLVFTGWCEQRLALLSSRDS